MSRPRSKTFHATSSEHACLTLDWIPKGFNARDYAPSDLTQVSAMVLSEPLLPHMLSAQKDAIIAEIFATKAIVANTQRILDRYKSSAASPPPHGDIAAVMHRGDDRAPPSAKGASLS